MGRLWILLGLLGPVVVACHSARPQTTGETRADPALAFEHNRGQHDAAVDFVARTDGATVFLAAGQATLVWPDRAVRLGFAGATGAGRGGGHDPLDGRVHYLRGDDPSGWTTDVPVYARVVYRDLYPGIDVVYYGNGRQLEFDLVLAPGADAAAVRLAYHGVDDLTIDADGALTLHAGAHALRQAAPVAYQTIDGARRPVDARYQRRGRFEVGLALGPHDASLPVTVDPIIDYATYVGGSQADEITGIAVDATGAVYLAGFTQSANFPTTAGALATASAGATDAFVVKLNAAGTARTYATYLGGSGDDRAHALFVDGAGLVYLVGETSSTNFPTTAGALRTTAAGGGDAFVAKLNAAGSALTYATYLGGSGADVATGVDVLAGSAVVTGSTASSGFPVTGGVVQSSYGGGAHDAFVARVNAAGSALTYSTFLGGSNDDLGADLIIFPSGEVTVVGETSSLDFPVIGSNAFGGVDPFLTRLNATGTAMVFSRYWGGSLDDGATAIYLDSSGTAYVAGYTYSNDMPVLGESTLHGPADAFEITMVSGTGLDTMYVGGNGSDFGLDITADAQGNPILVGETDSTDLAKNGATDITPGGGTDAFVVQIDRTGSDLYIGSGISFATFLGGTLDDRATAVAAGASGAVHVAGASASAALPTTAGVVQPALGGMTDGFVAKLTIGTVLSSLTPDWGPGAGGTYVELTGNQFKPGCTVTFGGVPSIGTVDFFGATIIRVQSPPHATGKVAVTVTNPDATTSTFPNSFEYNPQPTLTNVDPPIGSTTGGTTVYLCGTFFQPSATILFGGVAGTLDFVNNDGTYLQATTPAHAAGTFGVTVQHASGQSATLPASFTFQEPLELFSLDPELGPTTGGTTVTLSGVGFQPGAIVTFSSLTASIQSLTSDTIVVTTPPYPFGGSQVSVSVENPDGRYTQSLAYTYLAPPGVTEVFPPYGSADGGNVVDITGSEFTDTTTVRFGGTLATDVQFLGSQSLRVTTPAHAPGRVDLVLENPDGQATTLDNGYAFVGPPSLTSVSPPTGPDIGGAEVTLTGSDFLGGAQVLFGDVRAARTEFMSPTTIVAVAPAHAQGSVSITVRHYDGQESTLAGAFTFVPSQPPSIAAISPDFGPPAGGTTVIITGDHFGPGAIVRFDGTDADAIEFIDATALSARTPAHASGFVSVEVENPDGQVAARAGGFFYGDTDPGGDDGDGGGCAGCRTGGDPDGGGLLVLLALATVAARTRRKPGTPR